MSDSPRHRVIAIALLLVVLFGLFGWMGAMDPDPTKNHYPDAEDLATDYDAYVGEYVELSGTVVDTDPIVIEAEYPRIATIAFTVRAVDEPVERGQELRVFGRAEPDHTIRAEETFVRDQWERMYMFVISLLAAAWVVTRFVRQWQFDRASVAFVPRGEEDG